MNYYSSVLINKRPIHRMVFLVFMLFLACGLLAGCSAPADQHPTPAEETLHPASLTQDEAITRAFVWLHTQQAPYGAIGGPGASCDFARLIALAGQNPDGPAWTPKDISLLQRCKLDAPGFLTKNDAGNIAKVLRTVVVTDQDPHDFAGIDLITALETQFDPATGLYHPQNLFRDSLALLALHEAGRSIPEEAIAALIQQQHTDGCWGWGVGGDTTDADTTGLVLQALAETHLSAADSAIAKCIHTLRVHQNEDAGWGARWDDHSNSDSTALVIVGLAALKLDPASEAWEKNNISPVATLLSFQDESGAFWWRRDREGTLLMGVSHALEALLAVR